MGEATEECVRRHEARRDPNTTLLGAARRGYNPPGMTHQTQRVARGSTAHRHPWLRRLGLAFLLLIVAVFVSIILFRFVNPPITPVMVAVRLSGTPIQQHWVPLEDISPNLPLAVIASEDGQFCNHWGVDWAAVREAVNEARKSGESRGASTITMQTARNLYLGTHRSYVRKALEVPLAYLLTFFWTKERVMEVYLNIAQWGPGIFGAEAASQAYFHKSAKTLTRREALLLAAALPSPRLRNPGKPSQRMLSIARLVERRMPVLAKRSFCAVPKTAAAN